MGWSLVTGCSGHDKMLFAVGEIQSRDGLWMATCGSLWLVMGGNVVCKYAQSNVVSGMICFAQMAWMSK